MGNRLVPWGLFLLFALFPLRAAFAAEVAINILYGNPGRILVRVDDIVSLPPRPPAPLPSRIVAPTVLPGNITAFTLSVGFTIDPELRHYAMACAPGPYARSIVTVMAEAMPMGRLTGNPNSFATGVYINPLGACEIVGRGYSNPREGTVWENQRN